MPNRYKCVIFNQSYHLLSLIAAILVLLCCQEQKQRSVETIIHLGKAQQAIVKGDSWKTGNGYLYCPGNRDNFNNMVYSDFFVQDSNFHFKIKMSLDTIGQTTSLFWMFNNHFGFDSDDKGPDTKERLFIYTPRYDSLLYFNASTELITPGRAFDFEVIREGDEVHFFIDHQLITRQPVSIFATPFAGTIGIRPWKNTVKIYDWTIEGALAKLPDIDFVFENGKEGYACYRIPSIVKTNSGALLAFAEGREESCRDNGDVDIVMKRSTDDGRTWEPLQLIWEDSTNTCAYPVPVVDQQTGRVILLTVWSLGSDHWKTIFMGKGEDTRRIFTFFSDDDGITWSTKEEITDQVKKDNWHYYGVGAGSGLQIKKGKFKDRIIIPSYFNTFTNDQVEFRSHLIYSDDGGLNWSIGGISPETGTSECEVAEVNDGKLIVNMTKRTKKVRPRSVAYSDDGGLSLTNQQLDKNLYGPTCQASIDSYLDQNENFILLFSNPKHRYSRENLTLQISKDDGQTWSKQINVQQGYAGYSDIIPLNEEKVGILYECGKVWSRDGISYKEISIK